MRPAAPQQSSCDTLLAGSRPFRQRCNRWLAAPSASVGRSQPTDARIIGVVTPAPLQEGFRVSEREMTVTVLARRTFLFAASATPMIGASLALAVDALPDARFVGFAQAVNEFSVASGQLALARSTNENIRGYASRVVAEATQSAEALRKSRQEAGVSYAPDGNMGPKTANLLAQAQLAPGACVRYGLCQCPAFCPDRRRSPVGRLLAERKERAAQAIRAGDPSQVEGPARVRPTNRGRSIERSLV